MAVIHRTNTRSATGVAMLVAGALAAAGIGSAPTADASCISVFGLGSGGNCTSSFGSIAIAIGNNAAAHADDVLGAALAFGDDSTAAMVGGDLLNLAVAAGQSSIAWAGGFLSTAVSLGTKTWTQAGLAGNVGNFALDVGGHDQGGLGFAGASAKGYLNLAVNAFSAGKPFAGADGIGNNAVNAFGSDGLAYAFGRFNNATNFIGDKSRVNPAVPVNGSTLTWAFNFIGSNNQVSALEGPAAIAGAIGQTGQNVTLMGTGININGLKIGGAQAVRATSRTAPSAATARSAGKRVVPSSAKRVAAER